MAPGRRAGRGRARRPFDPPFLLTVIAGALMGFVAACEPPREPGEPEPPSASPQNTKQEEAATEPGPRGEASWAIDPPSVDLGLVGAEEERTAKFSVRNTGQAPLRLVEVVKSCGCLRPSYEQVELRPGESQDFDLALTTDGRSAHEYSVQLAVRQAGSVSRKTLYVRYTPKSRPVLEPPSLHFGFVRSGTEIERKVRLDLRVPGREIEPKVLCEVPDDLPVEVRVDEPEVEDLGGSYRVRATLRLILDSQRSGRFEGRVPIRTSQSDATVLVVKGTVHPGVYFEAEKLHLGRIVAGSRRTKEVALEGDPDLLSAISLASDTDWVTVTADDLEPGATRRRFQVTLRPPADLPEGERSIRLEVQGPLDAPVSLDLRVTSTAPRTDRGSGS